MKHRMWRRNKGPGAPCLVDVLVVALAVRDINYSNCMSWSRGGSGTSKYIEAPGYLALTVLPKRRHGNTGFAPRDARIA